MEMFNFDESFIAVPWRRSDIVSLGKDARTFVDDHNGIWTMWGRGKNGSGNPYDKNGRPNR